MAGDAAGADLVHSHTWYANFAGFTAKLLHGIPHVVTAHSLEPLRPWKAEQLGGGYRLSSWIERTAFEDADAVIAVSDGHAPRHPALLSLDRSRACRGGAQRHRPRPTGSPNRRCPTSCARSGVDPDRPSVVFVGRITRQKGLPYLLRAARLLPPDVQLVLCAGAPDTEEILAEVHRARRRAAAPSGPASSGSTASCRATSSTALLTAATAFVCPSVYEPLGIVNLEAMACGAPVVGTATGGIPEVVDDGVTGRPGADRAGR